ncbi:MAG TPA: hypothetical protein VFL12_02045 [Thermoanaerobaculia bacterium]|nr:hypothetical protein [Thermoanaerobaculia bacterium]
MSEERAPNHHDAELVLRLFDLRREAKLREARSWLGGFYPDSAQELHDAYSSPDAYLRMVAGYWDIATSMVNLGVIHRGLFVEAGGEAFFLWAKIGEYVPAFREITGNRGFLANVERFVRETPGGSDRVAGMREYQKKIRAQREVRRV